MRPVAFVLALAGLAACARFDVVQANQCGNGVIEAGEDCDQLFEQEEAGGCVACRVWCEPAEDPSDVTGCDPGWGCGDDHVCRHGTTTFAEVTAPADVIVSDMVVQDIDGDPFPDAIGYGPSEVWIARGTSGPGFVVSDRLPRVRTDVRPALGRLDLAQSFSLREPIAEVIVSSGPRAIATYRTLDGRFVPVPQPWTRTAASAHVAAPARTPISTPLQTIVLARIDTIAAEAQLSIDPQTTSLTLPAPVPCNPINLVLTAADLDEDGDDELLFSCPGLATIELVRIDDVGGVATLVDVGALALPDELDGPIVVADLDGDDRLDILAAIATVELTPDFAVIRQTSPLTFDAATIDTRLGGAKLLAAGDLDADGATDLVGSLGVYLTRGAVLEQAVGSIGWSSAVIADVNRDGVPDVTGVADGRLQTMIGAPDATYAPHLATTIGGAPAGIVAADLDGDQLDDVATIWSDGEVRILYGRPSGVFDTLVDAGTVTGTVAGFHAAQLDGVGLFLDTVQDLVVVQDRNVMVFTGSGVRPPIASLDALVDPRAIVLGSFDPIDDVTSSNAYDTIVLGRGQDTATLIYGESGGLRDLGQRKAMSAPFTGCTDAPALVTVANLDGPANPREEVVEVGCASGSSRTLSWRVVGDHDAPSLVVAEVAVLGGVVTRDLAVVDLDNDLVPEMVAATDDFGGPLRVIHDMNPNDGVATGVTELGLSYDIAGVAAGNVDVDPELEIVGGGEVLMIYDWNGGEPSTLLVPDPQSSDLGAPSGLPRMFDLDHDGVLDLVLGGDQLRVFRAIPHTEQ